MGMVDCPCATLWQRPLTFHFLCHITRIPWRVQAVFPTPPASSRGLPESIRGDLRSLDHGCELRPGNVWVNRECAGEGGEAAVGPGDDVLPPNHGCIALDALGNQFGMLDEVRGRVQYARNDDLLFR
jgi:hypothetical protein